ncbi:MAG TPA: MFS transporter [Anaerolineales bacterium]|nr:MFS transporter [Anaerolineales bacterium]
MSSNTSAKKQTHKLSIASLSAAFLVDSSEEQALPLLWPHMLSALGATVGQLGTILGASKLMTTILYPLWGYAADRYSRKMILVWFTGFWGLWTLGIAFVGNYPQLLTLRVISGLGLGAFAPAAFSLIGDLFDNQSRGRATGIMRSVGLVGIIISVILLPTLTENNPEGWRIGFAVLGLASFLSGLFMLVLKEPTRGASEPELSNVITKENVARYSFTWTEFWSLFRIRSWRYLLLNETLTKTSLAVFTGWNFTFLTSLELQTPFFYITIFVVFIGLVSGNIFFGWLGDRLDGRLSNRGRVTMMQIGLILSVPALIAYLTSSGENIGLLILFTFLAGASYTSTSEGVVWPMSHAVLPPELRGSSRAIISMAIGALSALALSLSGIVADSRGVTTALLWFVPGLILLSTIAWIPMFQTYSRDRDELHKLLEQRRKELLRN